MRLGFPRFASRSGAFQSQYVDIATSATKSTTKTKKSRRICGFTASPLSVHVVRDHEEDPEQEEVRDDARAAVRDERERDPGQRDEARDAADDDERLDR